MTITTPEGSAYADRIAEEFPEEYAAGLDDMDAEDAAALALCPTMGARADTIADPSAEADYGEVLDGLSGGDLGHAGHGLLPEEHFSSAVWEAGGPTSAPPRLRRPAPPRRPRDGAPGGRGPRRARRPRARRERRREGRRLRPGGPRLVGADGHGEGGLRRREAALGRRGLRLRAVGGARLPGRGGDSPRRPLADARLARGRRRPTQRARRRARARERTPLERPARAGGPWGGRQPRRGRGPAGRRGGLARRHAGAHRLVGRTPGDA